MRVYIPNKRMGREACYGLTTWVNEEFLKIPSDVTTADRVVEEVRPQADQFLVWRARTLNKNVWSEFCDTISVLSVNNFI